MSRDQVLTFRCEPELIQIIEQLASLNGVTRSEMTRLLVRRGIRAVVEDNGQSTSRPITAPSPPEVSVQDAVLAVRYAMRGDLHTTARVIASGNTLEVGTCLAGYVGVLLNEYEDPNRMLDKLVGEVPHDRPTKAQRKQRVIRRAERIAAGRP